MTVVFADYTKAEILKEIYSANLSAEKNSLWEKFITAIPVEFCVDILYFLKNVPGGVKSLTANLEEKNKALAARDLNKWEELSVADANFVKSFIKK